MPQPKPALERCPERQEITDSFQAITEQIVALLYAEVDAVVNADMERMEQLENNLRTAVGFQESLRERYITHTQSHGCTPQRSVVWRGRGRS